MNSKIAYLQEPFCFSSKADVLQALSTHEALHIPQIFTFAASEWIENEQQVLSGLRAWATEHDSPLAIRSSCRHEDSTESSGAGAFTSVLNVPPDENALRVAIDTVIASYGESSPDDQVLVQLMVQDVTVSGVIMTLVLADGSPYYVINYDDESGKTDTITGGHEGTKTVYIFRDAQDSDFDSQRLLSFVNFARRIESLCGRSDLDIEFCLSADGVLHLLQVRPICTQQQWIVSSDAHVRRHIDFIVDFLENRMRSWPGMYGGSTILGVMPDWNPAEMIGVTPRQLASSLYRELITRRVWSQARELMGYRAMPPDELMVMLAGRPYIDVRASFNSLLPKGLEAVTGEALVTAWLEYLDRHPQLHDKVEFDVAQTALDFCFEEHFNARYPGLLSRKRKDNFRDCLCQLTNRCLDLSQNGSVALAFDAVAELRNRQSARPTPELTGMEHNALLPQLVSLCEECCGFGTRPFSVLARHAFIAEALLRTAVKREALTPERLAAFKASLRTVSGEMSQDFIAVCRGEMARANFMTKYGHLRPSTYDILSPRYADREALFMDNTPLAVQLHEPPPFTFNAKEQCAITQLMQEAGLNGDATLLENYARRVIPGRELAKFIFSRNLSDMLELVAKWGALSGLDRNMLSFIDVRDILEWSSHALLQKPSEYFRELSSKGQKLFNVSRSLKLGYLIRSARDIYVVPQHRSAPNFIGSGKLEAPVLCLHADTPCSVDMAGHLVCIENADPGFDWIFTRNIAGLVTMFGGTNSHMAIRCAEYGLPAAIGVGTSLFERISRATHGVLNAGACTLQSL